MKRFVRYIGLRTRALLASCRCTSLLVGMAGSDGSSFSIRGGLYQWAAFLLVAGQFLMRRFFKDISCIQKNRLRMLSKRPGKK